ncbi:MAG: DUF4912 domain-containing protein [Candidatus Omnitrophica bacterium]|nr:DUF4912 domain-containing protein [Candidatus Omnitrophota bacterium]
MAKRTTARATMKKTVTGAKQRASRLSMAMDKKGLEQKTRVDLLAIATQAGVVGRSKMTKAQLVDALLKNSHSSKPQTSTAPALKTSTQAAKSKASTTRTVSRSVSAKKTTTKGGVVKKSKASSKPKPAVKPRPAVNERPEPKQSVESVTPPREVSQRSQEPPLISTAYLMGQIPSEAIGSSPRTDLSDWESLPPRYGDHRIVLMVRDPWWLYTYWEVRPEEREQLVSKMLSQGDPPRSSVLRIYDVTGVNFTGSNANRYFDLHVDESAENWYVDVGEPGRSFLVELGLLGVNGGFYPLVRSNRVSTPSFGPSDKVDEEWMCLEEDYWRLLGAAGGFPRANSSMELQQLLRERLQEILSSESLFSEMPSGRPVGIRVDRRRQFSFWVKAEWILYGGTEPDAEVLVNGERVPLRSDGTFTFRFALPEGEHRVPVTATSSDRVETRGVTCQVDHQMKDRF